MPQITMAWPEASVMGFETVLGASDLGYAGLPFNWVTNASDQFTFTALDRLLRDDPDDRPLFVQIALGSSHAPWVPVPRNCALDQVGDGTIFDPWRRRATHRTWSGATATVCATSTGRPSNYALRVIFGGLCRTARRRPAADLCGGRPPRRLASSPLMNVRTFPFTSSVRRRWSRPRRTGAGTRVSCLMTPRWRCKMDRMRDLILQSYAAEAAQGGDS